MLFNVNVSCCAQHLVNSFSHSICLVMVMVLKLGCLYFAKYNQMNSYKQQVQTKIIISIIQFKYKIQFIQKIIQCTSLP